ncbi:MAG: hypothetical protein EAZ24_01335 [Burkholderiales bacterium]|nr:MAG: hypothetical protein EAZ21_14105 [Betaproteobacteria bacterium]TAG84431.1 MAG: hypothetical protein EAZ24_01335 [Burkholderiales bacterium]
MSKRTRNEGQFSRKAIRRAPRSLAPTRSRISLIALKRELPHVANYALAIRSTLRSQRVGTCDRACRRIT